MKDEVGFADERTDLGIDDCRVAFATEKTVLFL